MTEAVRSPLYEQLSDREVFDLAVDRGKKRKVADSRFLAILPELEVRKAFQLGNYESLSHFASLAGGCIPEMPPRIARLSAKLAPYMRLWSLLDEGTVGWAKLETFADVVTPETIELWRWRAQHWSKQVLAEEARQTRARSKAMANPPESRSVAESTSASSDVPAPASPGDPARSCEVSEIRSPSPEPDNSTETNGGTAIRGSGHAFAAEPSFSSVTVDTSDTGTASPTSSPLKLGSTTAPFDFGDPRDGIEPASPGVEVAGTNSRVSLELDALALERLHALKNDSEPPISLGELVSNLIHAHYLARPSVAKSPGGCARDPDCTEAHAKQDSDRTPNGRLALTIGPSEPEIATHGANRIAKGKSPLRDRAILEFVIRDGDTQAVMTASGLVPVSADKLIGLPRYGVDLDELRVAAIAAANRATGRAIPHAVKRYTLARGMLRCESGGCPKGHAEFDHIRALANGGTHDPDNVRSVCAKHHDTKHSKAAESARDDASCPDTQYATIRSAFMRA